jgi:putative DNA modification/repair radical SAM protein
MELMDKLTILADSAKYDVACTSSGAQRAGNRSGLGSAVPEGICHTFSADGRCVSLLKVLLSNVCVYDCKYCVNRRSNDVPRASFTPKELTELTIGFYRRNYIEGLFLSSAVVRNPNYTMEQMIRVLELLRGEYHFRGYIHAKAIPGADRLLVERLGLLADRLSVNIELPSEQSLTALAPDKSKQAILAPMAQVRDGVRQNSAELMQYRHAPRFAPAGQSTQMIIGASGETDHAILRLTEGLYKKYALKRVFFSAYIPVAEDALLPSRDTQPPLLREHRLYQADWLLRFYGFAADELLDEKNTDFNPYLDPKCNWAIHNMAQFPVDVNRCSYQQLLRVPGIGVKSAQRICTARKGGALGLDELRRMGVVLKRAQYFIVCRGFTPAHASPEGTVRALLDPKAFEANTEQLSLFAAPEVHRLAQGGTPPTLAANWVKEEAVICLARQM